MTGKKRVLNVTVDEDVASDVRHTAEEEGVTISSVVEEALREHLKWENIRQKGIVAIEAYFDEHGWPTPEEEAESEARVTEAIRLLDEAHERNMARRRAEPRTRGNVA